MAFKGGVGGSISKFFSNPVSAIISLVLLSVGITFLSTAAASGGILSTLMNDVELVLNNMGLTSLSSMFNSGGVIFLVIGVVVLAGALYALTGKGRN